MNKIFLFAFVCFTLFGYTQNEKESTLSKNKKYLEDQFYIGITYNLLSNKPSGINLRGFSNTLLVGYLRDISFDKKNNLGIGIGLGYSRTNYFHNMKIVKFGDDTLFSHFTDTEDFSSNKLIFNAIDLPFEFRIRNSTYAKNKFWRLYFGMTFSYVFQTKAQFILSNKGDDGEVFTSKHELKNFDNFNKLQYGLTLSSGVGTWNGYLYYGLTNLFDNAKFNETDTIDVKSIRFGLIFYVL